MNAQPMYNVDNHQLLSFKRELEYIDPQAVVIKKGMLKALEIFQLATNIPAGATEYGYDMVDRLGRAKFLAPSATDIPEVDATATRLLQPIGFAGVNISYTVADVYKASLVGARDIITDKRLAAQEAVAQLHNTTFWTGNTDLGIVGIMTNTNIPNAAVAATGTGSTTTWSTKTGQQIIDDINEAIGSVIGTSLGIERPDLIVMDSVSYHVFTTKRIADGTDETVMTAFRKQHPNIRFEQAEELKGAFTGGANGFLLGTNNSSYIKLVAPVVYREMPVQQRGYGFQVPVMAYNGGAEIRYPKAFVKRYGI